MLARPRGRHPDAEKVFAGINQNRWIYGFPPLCAKRLSEDVIRERLKDLDGFRRWARRQGERS
jgi:hypothetical protein